MRTPESEARGRAWGPCWTMTSSSHKMSELEGGREMIPCHPSQLMMRQPSSREWQDLPGQGRALIIGQIQNTWKSEISRKRAESLFNAATRKDFQELSLQWSQLLSGLQVHPACSPTVFLLPLWDTFWRAGFPVVDLVCAFMLSLRCQILVKEISL